MISVSPRGLTAVRVGIEPTVLRLTIGRVTITPPYSLFQPDFRVTGGNRTLTGWTTTNRAHQYTTVTICSPGRIRTYSILGLSQLPLPVGIQGRAAREVVWPEGFEPSLRDPKSRMLPLNITASSAFFVLRGRFELPPFRL